MTPMEIVLAGVVAVLALVVLASVVVGVRVLRRVVALTGQHAGQLAGPPGAVVAEPAARVVAGAVSPGAEVAGGGSAGSHPAATP